MILKVYSRFNRGKKIVCASQATSLTSVHLQGV